MKMTFDGWSRGYKTHEHQLKDMKKYRKGSVSYSVVDINAENKAVARIENMDLHGSYEVKIEFKDEELLGWINNKIKKDPRKMIEMLHAILGDEISSKLIKNLEI